MLLSVSVLLVFWEVLSCISVFKATSYFLIYEVQFIWIYVEVLIHLNLSFVDSDRCVIFYMLISSYSSIIFKRCFLFSIVPVFAKNQVLIGALINARVFYSILLIHMSVLMLIPSCFYYYTSIVKYEVRDTSRWGCLA